MAMTQTTYEVHGMTCDHCVRAVTEELQKVDGVTHVTVDLETGWATVSSEGLLDVAAVASAVDEAGYSLS